MVYGHANGSTRGRNRRTPCKTYIDHGLSRGSRAVRDPGRRSTPTASAAARCITSRRRRAVRSRASGAPSAISTSCRRCSSGCASEFGFDVHLLHDVHHRLTPIEAARLGKSLEPYAAVLARGSGAGGESGGVPHDPPAHDHADRRRRGVQHDLRLRAAHRGRADRLHPHDRRPCRRHQPPAEDRGARRAAPRADRIARRDRSEPGRDGRRRCISISACTTSASRSTCGTPTRPTACFRTRTRSSRGAMHPGDAPGLGVDIDEALAARYPYDPAYLPVNR